MAAALDLDGPALAPPDGVTPDFSRPENKNGLAIFVLTLCAAVATICLLLRAYARVYLLRKVGLEEGMSASMEYESTLADLYPVSSFDCLRICSSCLGYATMSPWLMRISLGVFLGHAYSVVHDD